MLLGVEIPSELVQVQEDVILTLYGITVNSLEFLHFSTWHRKGKYDSRSATNRQLKVRFFFWRKAGFDKNFTSKDCWERIVEKQDIRHPSPKQVKERASE